MATDKKAMTNQQLAEAVSHLVAREDARDAKQKRRQQRRVIERRKESRQRIEKLTQSIEVIKWCIVSIASVMAVALLILVLVVMEVQREAERIKAEVQHIQREAEMIREKIRHPLESLGGTLGRRLDQEVRELVGDK